MEQSNPFLCVISHGESPHGVWMPTTIDDDDDDDDDDDSAYDVVDDDDDDADGIYGRYCDEYDRSGT